jgi:hypothetical protein
VQIGGSLGLAVLVTLALRRAASSAASGASAAVAATNGYALAFRGAAFAMFAAAVVAFLLVPGRPRVVAMGPELADGTLEEVERLSSP